MAPSSIKFAIVILALASCVQSVFSASETDDDYYEEVSPYDGDSKVSHATSQPEHQPSKITNQSPLNSTSSMTEEVILQGGIIFQKLPEDEKYERNNCQIKDCGEALFLTPYIASGKITEAVNLAKVTEIKSLRFAKSYSGFLTVDKESDSNVFFWFFTALNGEISSPLIIWLEGGPGKSALFSTFNSHGPYKLDERLRIHRRNYTWTETFNVLYLDGQVGTGFSFTKSSSGYPRSHDEVSDYLYKALEQFFSMFPDYKYNQVYICGEGYGAKFAVSLSHKIHVLGERSVLELKGVMLGNPYLEQELMTPQAEYLYDLGLLDDEDFHGITNVLRQAKLKVQKMAWSEAMDKVEEVFGSPYKRPLDSKYYLPDLTGLPQELDLLEVNHMDRLNRYVTFVNQPYVRKAIHVGNQPFQSGRLSYEAMREDIPQSVKWQLSILLNHYRMLFYGGNMNPRCPYSLAVNILHRVRWDRMKDYKDAPSMIWKVELCDREIAGYVHRVKNFYEVMVRNSGNFVAKDQPRAAQDMLKRFIWGRAFNTEEY